MICYTFKDDNIDLIDLLQSRARNWTQTRHTKIEFEIKWIFIDFGTRLQDVWRDLTTIRGLFPQNPNQKSSPKTENSTREYPQPHIKNLGRDKKKQSD